MATEKRLISADVAKEMIVNHANEFSDVLNRREKALLIGGGTSCIDKCPTVDAVEVVRCKDCKHSALYEDGTIFCKLHSEQGEKEERSGSYSVWMEPDDFCSYGEKREV